jgi:hypothetical protein
MQLTMLFLELLNCLSTKIRASNGPVQVQSAHWLSIVCICTYDHLAQTDFHYLLAVFHKAIGSAFPQIVNLLECRWSLDKLPAANAISQMAGYSERWYLGVIGAIDVCFFI